MHDRHHHGFGVFSVSVGLGHNHGVGVFGVSVVVGHHLVIIMVLVWAVEWVMDEKLTPARLPTTQGQGHDGDGEALGDGDGDT